MPAKKTGPAFPPIAPPGALLEALKTRHGEGAIREVETVLRRSEARQDRWATGAALRVLVHRPADKTVGGLFVKLIRAALNGERMDDPREVDARLGAERAAVFARPELLGSGEWGLLGGVDGSSPIVEPDLDAHPPPRPQTHAEWRAGRTRAALAAAAEAADARDRDTFDRYCAEHFSDERIAALDAGLCNDLERGQISVMTDQQTTTDDGESLYTIVEVGCKGQTCETKSHRLLVLRAIAYAWQGVTLDLCPSECDRVDDDEAERERRVSEGGDE